MREAQDDGNTTVPPLGSQILGNMPTQELLTATTRENEALERPRETSPPPKMLSQVMRQQRASPGSSMFASGLVAGAHPGGEPPRAREMSPPTRASAAMMMQQRPASMSPVRRMMRQNSSESALRKASTSPIPNSGNVPPLPPQARANLAVGGIEIANRAWSPLGSRGNSLTVQSGGSTPNLPTVQASQSMPQLAAATVLQAVSSAAVPPASAPRVLPQQRHPSPPAVAAAVRSPLAHRGSPINGNGRGKNMEVTRQTLPPATLCRAARPFAAGCRSSR